MNHSNRNYGRSFTVITVRINMAEAQVFAQGTHGLLGKITHIGKGYINVNFISSQDGIQLQDKSIFLPLMLNEALQSQWVGERCRSKSRKEMFTTQSEALCASLKQVLLTNLSS